MKKTGMLILVLLLCGFVAAGCGSDKKKDSSTTAASAPAGGTATSGGGSTGSSGAATDSAAAAAAKQGCEAGIKNNPALDASKRAELSKECQKLADAAGSGDKARYKKEYGVFCGKLADALPAQARGPAKAACDQAVNAIQ